MNEHKKDILCHCGGQEHNHKSCSCESEHSHEVHEHCSCEHKHEHSAQEGHPHDHCSCSDCSCGDGCGHQHSAGSAKDLTALGISAVLLAVSFLPAVEVFSPWLMVASLLVAGFPLFIQGVKSLFRLNFNELLLLTIAVVASVCIGEYFEAAIVTILFRLGEMLEERAVQKSKREIEALTSIRPDDANLQQEDGSFITVDAREVPIDSIIQIRPGERIPLDCVVLSGSSSVDQSSLTGESIPVNVKEGDQLLSSAINGGGLLICKTTSDFSGSFANRMIALVEESSGQKGKTENFITRFAKVYTPIIMVLAAALAILPPLLGMGSFEMWLSRCLVFLVASCPCALVISIPLSFFAGIGGCSKKGVIVKGSKYMELLSKADCAVFDKTGTLTTGKLSVTRVQSVGGYSEKEVLQVAAAAESMSNHPIAQAIAAHQQQDFHPQISDYSEISGKGIEMVMDGKTILCGSRRLLEENNVDIQALDNLPVCLAIDGIAAGGVEISDSLREDAPATLKGLKQAGVEETVMLTGDNEANAQKISKQAGVDRFFAGLLPQDKVSRMKELKSRHKVTLFTGDGINDAPVLAGADIGVAMGFGTDAAIEAADVVLVSDRLLSLVDAIHISKKTMGVARFNIAFALIVKVVVLLLGAMGLAQMWMAVFADVGVSIIAVLNSVRILGWKGKNY
ncbi:heavy metal translocating P-type ATPase [Youxingia wuxianensis]|uniref:Cd(2+)-exporting ATPase n=1 Tax=Youxingia wuxianensis TaxID=2763678 RepID=A0A926IIM6_9FIRM|nr:heavy metal translocating P-type ATPase [Youxingia wuxianensis]MBC8586516.1 cadmium-translocating P-type ATPase [Youxingia wuxianensis]